MHRLIPIVAGFAIAANGATYYWKPGSTVADYASLANWSTESATGASATALPGGGDSLALKANYAFDLGGGSYTLANWGAQGTDADQEYSLSFSNGTLKFSHLDAAPSSVTVGNGGTLDIPGRYGAGDYNNTSTARTQRMTVKSGGTVNIYDANPCFVIYTVEAGGTLSFHEKYFGAYNKGVKCTDETANGIWNNGTLNLTKTSNVNEGEFRISGVDRNEWRFTIAQQGGTLNLPCNINGKSSKGSSTRKVQMYVSFSGGTINVTGDAKVYNCESLTISGTTVWNVAEGKTADLTAATLANDAAVTKQGAGALALPDVPYSLTIAGAVPTFAQTTTTAMGTLAVEGGYAFTVPATVATIDTLSVADGATLTIAKPGLSVGGAGDLSGTIAINASAFGAAGAVVVTSPNAAVRSAFAAAAEAAGLVVEDTGEAVVVASSTEVVFDAAHGDVSTVAGWTDCGAAAEAIPAAGRDVIIDGAGVAVAASATLPAWKSITVRNGATLKVSAAYALPPVILEDTATLEIAAAVEGQTLALGDTATSPALVVDGGASLKVAASATLPAVTLKGSGVLEIAADATLGGGDILVADASSGMPTLKVDSGATLSVDGGTKFKGFNLALNGTLAATTAGDLYLGYAAADETDGVPFGLAIDGGTVTTVSGSVNFFTPETGGAVALYGDAATIKDATFALGGNGGFNFCEGNPASVPVAFAIDNTTLNYPTYGAFTIGGGAALTFANGSKLCKTADQTSYAWLFVKDSATLAFEDGSELFYDASKAVDGRTDGLGNGGLQFAPAEVGAKMLTFRNSKFFWHHAFLADASKPITLVVDGATYEPRCGSNWNFFQPFRSDKNGTVILSGVELAGDWTLTASSAVPNFNSSVHYGDDPRSIVSPATVPFTGTGGIVLESTYANRPFAMTINSSANTATGTLAAGENTTLTLADGANWAGVVDYTDNVVLGALSGASAGTVTVGGIKLEKNFTFRVWSKSNADKLHVGQFGIEANRHRFAVATQGNATFATGDEIVVGSVPEGTEALPGSASAEWAFKLGETVTDGKVDLIAYKTDVSYVFNGGDDAAIVDLSDVDGWTGEEIPEGVDVYIDGVTAIVNSASGTVPQFASITLRNGAGLRVSTSASLPAITLNQGTSLAVEGGGVEVSLGSLSMAATGGAANVPSVTIGDGASVTVPGGTRFTNANLRLEDGSSFAATGEGGLYFGYAAADAVSYFAMYATNATIDAASGRVYFGSPEAGGTVAVADPISLIDVTFKSVKGYTFGVNNPVANPFEVVADGTSFAIDGSVTIGGAATLKLLNGAQLAGSNANALTVTEAGQIAIGAGGLVKYTPNTGSPRLVLGGPANAERPAVVLSGGTFWPWKLDTASGAKRTIEVAADSSWDMHYHEFWSSDHRNIPFDAAAVASVAIGEGATLALRNINGGSWNSSGNLDRRYHLGKAPLTGEGNLVFTNAFAGCASTMIFQGGANTCTGSLSADAATRVFFQDGANWAGKVVAEGNIALTNGAAAAHVSFGALHLKSGTFPVRVWKTGDGAYVCDTIDFTGAGLVQDGGSLEFVPQGDWTLDKKTVLYLGKWSKSAALPGLVKAGKTVMKLTAVAIDGDSENVAVYGRVFCGFTIRLR